MKSNAEYDSYLLSRREKIERRLSIYLALLEKKGFVTSVNQWWETVTGYEPVLVEDEDAEELCYNEPIEFINHPGIPATGYVSLSIRHRLEDDDDAITYVLPVCTDCGGEGEQLDLAAEEIDVMFKEIAKIARKGNIGYVRIKKAHIKEIMRNLMNKSQKPLKTGVIVTICIVGVMLIGAAITMIIVL